MDIEKFMQAAMTKREEKGLRLDWIVDGEPFTAYPKNEVQKAKFIASGERQGWELK